MQAQIESLDVSFAADCLNSVCSVCRTALDAAGRVIAAALQISQQVCSYDKYDCSDGSHWIRHRTLWQQGWLCQMAPHAAAAW